MNQQQIKQQLQELTVAKTELTSGDTSGLVYVRSSPGAAFLVTPRLDVLRKVVEEMDERISWIIPEIREKIHTQYQIVQKRLNRVSLLFDESGVA
eukprot:CCRYP_008196-RC/>CCRYP_008196-RC protein AED:0.45 eAED:0.67 QI:0/0/0/1/0/0/2/0/94